MARHASRRLTLALFGLAALGWPAAALAHAGTEGAGFASGALHPLTGIDHVLAMLAVGMWGAQLGAPAIWALPVAFPLVMSLGGVAGILGIPLPAVEPGIALSVIVLGAAIAANLRPPLPVACALVSVFAIFHGCAHGLELPRHESPVAYSAGFVLATGAIHLLGIGIGTVTHLRNGLGVLRLGGSAISLAGVLIGLHLLGG